MNGEHDDTHKATADSANPGPAELGAQLRSAREAAGLDVLEAGEQLRLPARLITRLEAGDYSGLTQGVFLRGYLTSYARLVGVDVTLAEAVAERCREQPPLVATGTVPRSRYLFDRYSVSATYLVLTAIIVVPAVWLATHGGLRQELARTVPLDPPVDASGARPDDLLERLPLPMPVIEPPTGPVIASLTPFPTHSPAPAAGQVAGGAGPGPAPGPEPVTGSGRHLLELALSEQSWVEITAEDGSKLEYAMLQPGSHQYRSSQPVTVRLGNAGGVQLSVDGAALDLAPFQRANVALVRLFDAGGAPPERPSH